jgi:hypothetical protein
VKPGEFHQFLALRDVSGSNRGATVTERSEEPSFRSGDRAKRPEVTENRGIGRVPGGIFIRSIWRARAAQGLEFETVPRRFFSMISPQNRNTIYIESRS